MYIDDGWLIEQTGVNDMTTTNKRSTQSTTRPLLLSLMTALLQSIAMLAEQAQECSPDENSTMDVLTDIEDDLLHARKVWQSLQTY